MQVFFLYNLFVSIKFHIVKHGHKHTFRNTKNVCHWINCCNRHHMLIQICYVLFFQCCPGYVATDMSSYKGHKTVQQGYYYFILSNYRSRILYCLSSFCVPNVACTSRLSILDCPFLIVHSWLSILDCPFMIVHSWFPIQLSLMFILYCRWTCVYQLTIWSWQKEDVPPKM
jgi:hypothetical protein